MGIWAEKQMASVVKKYDESQQSYKKVLKGEPIEESHDMAVLRIQKNFRTIPYYRFEQQLIGPSGPMKLVSGEIMAKLSKMTELAHSQIDGEVAGVLAELIKNEFMVLPEAWTDLGGSSSSSGGGA